MAKDICSSIPQEPEEYKYLWQSVMLFISMNLNPQSGVKIAVRHWIFLTELIK